MRNELQGEVTATKKKQMAELQPRIDEIEASHKRLPLRDANEQA